MTPPSIRRTRSAKRKVRLRKTKSPIAPFRDLAVETLGSAMSAGTAHPRWPVTIGSMPPLAPHLPLRGSGGASEVRHLAGARTRALGERAFSSLGRASCPHRLPVGTLDLLQALLDQFNHAVRHRHVIELLCRLAAVVIGPVEEIQRLARDVGLGLLLVHQDEARAGNRPTVFPWLVGQQQIEILRLGPVGI